MTALQAYDRLMEAIEAKDAARARALAEVDRQFAGVLALRHREFGDAVRREQESGK